MTMNYTGIEEGTFSAKCDVLNETVILKTKITVVDGEYIGEKVVSGCQSNTKCLLPRKQCQILTRFDNQP